MCNLNTGCNRISPRPSEFLIRWTGEFIVFLCSAVDISNTTQRGSSRGSATSPLGEVSKGSVRGTSRLSLRTVASPMRSLRQTAIVPFRRLIMIMII